MIINGTILLLFQLTSPKNGVKHKGTISHYVWLLNLGSIEKDQPEMGRFVGWLMAAYHMTWVSNI